MSTAGNRPTSIAKLGVQLENLQNSVDRIEQTLQVLSQQILELQGAPCSEIAGQGSNAIAKLAIESQQQNLSSATGGFSFMSTKLESPGNGADSIFKNSKIFPTTVNQSKEHQFSFAKFDGSQSKTSGAGSCFGSESLEKKRDKNYNIPLMPEATTLVAPRFNFGNANPVSSQYQPIFSFPPASQSSSFGLNPSSPSTFTFGSRPSTKPLYLKESSIHVKSGPEHDDIISIASSSPDSNVTPSVVNNAKPKF